MLKQLKKSLVTILLYGIFCSSSHAAEPLLEDKIEAIVNQGVVLKSDLDEHLKIFKKKIFDSLPADQRPPEIFLRKQLLDQLIDLELISQLAEKMGIKISDMQLDSILDLTAKTQGKTVNQLYEESYKLYGLTPLETREKYKKETIVQQLQHLHIKNRIKISNQEIEQQMKILEEQSGIETKYNIQTIFLRNENSAENDNTYLLAKNIYDKLVKGENFKNLAIKYSQDPKASNGGDWGYAPINELPTVISENIMTSKVGDIIGPIHVDAGYIIIKINDIKGEVFKPDVNVHSRHIIIIPTIILSDEQVVDLLNKYRDDILADQTKFEEYAKKYSEDPVSAVNGGDLGYANPSTYDPAFAQVLDTLKIGEISKPFKTSFGWHIVQLLDKKIDTNTNTQLREHAYEILFKHRYNDELILWLNELRNSSYIKIVDPELTSEAINKLVEEN